MSPEALASGGPPGVPGGGPPGVPGGGPPGVPGRAGLACPGVGCPGCGPPRVLIAWGPIDPPCANARPERHGEVRTSHPKPMRRLVRKITAAEKGSGTGVHDHPNSMYGGTAEYKPIRQPLDVGRRGRIGAVFARLRLRLRIVNRRGLRPA
ncbi:MAG: hypothetical protein EA381_03175 [Planctomycetaceae bacterium]|nr:MAG: hypothetical protein EA381_03175 [Planctomycetaceae bacterium]